MRGEPCGLHPPSIMGKKSSPCGRSDKHVEVEDHGNGYLFLGCADIKQARRLLREYVDKPKRYGFAARPPNQVDSKGNAVCAVWLTDGPGELWDGVVGWDGKPVPRSSGGELP